MIPEQTMAEEKTTALLNFVEGDATCPQGEGVRLIVHCCNNVPAWGSGFVVALSKRWEAPERKYRKMGDYRLGAAEFVRVEDKIWVCNIIGQDGIGIGKDGMPPVRYEAIRKGFLRCVTWCQDNKATVHMPRIASGLAGGDWALVERLIEVTFGKAEIPVTVYDFPGGRFSDSRS